MAVKAWQVLAPIAAAGVSGPSSAADQRARLIVLTDIGNEPDDSESMVCLPVYANDIDIEGLLQLNDVAGTARSRSQAVPAG